MDVKGTHKCCKEKNVKKEYRDLIVSAVITQCYRDIGARHRARAYVIQITR